jgi:hypothetical protein
MFCWCHLVARSLGNTEENVSLLQQSLPYWIKPNLNSWVKSNTVSGKNETFLNTPLQFSVCTCHRWNFKIHNKKNSNISSNTRILHVSYLFPFSVLLFSLGGKKVTQITWLDFPAQHWFWSKVQIKKRLVESLFILFYFGGIGVWTQGFTVAKQAFCGLNLASLPVCFGYFGNGILQLFAQVGLKPRSSLSQLPK